MPNLHDDSTANPPQTGNAIDQARDQLKLLGIFYYLLGLMALPTLIVLAFHGPILEQVLASVSDPEMDALIEKLVNTSLIGFILLILVHVFTCFYIGVCFRKQRHHTLCIVAAAFCCLSFPLGTILGIFSIVVLMKPEAKQLFGIVPASQ